MASQVLSGANNASYTNNTGQNIRLIINYMANVTSMTWAGVNVTAESTTIGKDIQNITGELRQAVRGADARFNRPRIDKIFAWEAEISPTKAYLVLDTTDSDPYTGEEDQYLPSNTNTITTRGDLILSKGYNTFFDTQTSEEMGSKSGRGVRFDYPNLFYVPLTVSRGGNFPVELMLANGQSFSSVCGAYNAIVIKEDGT